MSIADLSNDISMMSKKRHQTNCNKTVDCSCGCEDDEEERSFATNINRTQLETNGMLRLHQQREHFA